MNTITLIGNLATDVTVRQAGDQLTGWFKIAVNRPGKDKGADFIPVKVWNGTATACSRYIGKGSKVGVTGELRTNRKANDDGTFTEYYEVNARRVEFLTPRNAEQDEEAPTSVASSTEPPSDDDIPF